jgi:hypothetical protein
MAVVSLMKIVPEFWRRFLYQLFGINILPCRATVILRHSGAPQILGLGLRAADPDVFGVVEEHEASLVLHELNIHSQNLYLVDHLQIVTNLVTVLEAGGLRVPQLKRQIIITKLLVIVLNGTVVLGSELGTSILRLQLRLLPAFLLRHWLAAMTNGRESELERFAKADLRLRSQLNAS